jgi:uncharacterized protein YjeT (DUF2065 family)
MNRTRLSLYYLASYLVGGGACFLLLPQLSATLFQSNGSYPDVMLRAIGMFMVALGFIVIQIIRHRAEAFYLTTLMVRAFICAGLIAFFLMVKDPLFLVLLVIVVSGMLFTGYNYLRERSMSK